MNIIKIIMLLKNLLEFIVGVTVPDDRHEVPIIDGNPGHCPDDVAGCLSHRLALLKRRQPLVVAGSDAVLP